MAYPDPKGERDNSMPAKRWSAQASGLGCRGTRVIWRKLRRGRIWKLASVYWPLLSHSRAVQRWRKSAPSHPGAIGGGKMKKERAAAAEGGLQLTTSMALALTDSRLVVLNASRPSAMGRGGDAKELVSAVPVTEVDSIELKRLVVGKVVIVTIRGVSVNLEAGPGANAKGLVDEFARREGARPIRLRRMGGEAEISMKPTRAALRRGGVPLRSR